MGPVLVTGACGFVGKALTPVLREAGHVVVTTSLSGEDADEQGIDLSIDAGPLLEKVRPQTVVHLAGGTRGDVLRSNIYTTARVLEAGALMSPPPHFVIFGSAAEYGGSEGLLTEESPAKPLSDYGHIKAAQISLAKNLACLKVLNLTVLRPFNVVSPDLPPSTALGRLRRLMMQAAGPEPVIACGRLDIVRDYISLEFLVNAIVRTVALLPHGHTINVCSGTGISLWELLDEMASRLGLRPRFEVDPGLAAIPAASRVVGNPSKLENQLGVSFDAYPSRIANLVLGLQT